LHLALERYAALMFRRLALIGALVSLSMAPFTSFAHRASQDVLEPVPGSILAPVSRQAGWLSLEAPRPRLLTGYQAPSYVADLAVSSTGAAVIVVQSVYPGLDVFGGDLLRLDLESGATTPLVMRTDATEALGSPVWQPDGSGLLFQRDDVRLPPLAYAGQATARYPSRLEVVQSDGSNRSVLLEDARQPTVSPSGAQMAYLRSSRAGTALLIRSQSADLADERELIPAGQFLDLAYPRFAPVGEWIAFAAVTPIALHDNLFDTLFGAAVAYAHGLPSDIWLIRSDGLGLHQVAAVSADDPSVSWSPDGSQLFIYGGSGSAIVDVATGELARYAFLSGYGATAWIPDRTN
jgi:Tol biopolymer transport system component